MLQEPEGQPDESVDVLFHDAGAMDDPTLAEYNTEEMLRLKASLTIEQTLQEAALF
jgi:hypothetical protein